MKRNRGTLIAVIVVGALLAFTILDAKRVEKNDREKREANALFKASAGDVVKVEISDRNPTRILEKKDGVWRLTAPIEDLADVLEVTPLTEAIERETALETVSEERSEEKVDLATFGLEKPGVTAKVTLANGETQTVKFGSVSSYDGSFYAQRGDDPKVFLVGGSLEGQLSKRLTEWRDKHLYRGPKERMFTSIELNERDAKGKTKYRVTLVKGEKAWSMKEIDAPLEVPAIEAFIEQVRALRALDFTELDKKNAAALKEHRLDEPQMTVKLGDGKGEPYSIAIGPPLAEGEKAPRAAVSSDLATIVSIYGAAYTTLEKRPEDFLDRKAPFKYQVNDATRIQIRAPRANPPYTADFEKKGPDWVLISSEGATGGLQKDLNTSKLNDVLTRMSVLEAVRFLEPVQASKVQLDSFIRLLKKDGSVEFEMKWGKPVTATPNADVPEVTYVPVTTSSSKRVVGVPTASLESLGITDLGEEQTKQTASPSATPAQ
ncbi:MAG: DUF4340 domain-containing protein [Bdellovibrionota bacterium]